MKFFNLFFFVAALMSNSHVHANAQESKVDLNSPECQEFIRFAKKDMNTYGVVVLKDGEKILEFYERGASEKNKFKLWSVSKTFSGLMLGALIKQNKLSLETKVSEYLPQFKKAQKNDKEDIMRSDINLRHLWTMASGLDWCEYTTCSPLSPLRVLYSTARENAASFVASHAAVHTPGDVYAYSAGNAILMQQVFKEMSESQKAYEELPNTLLFSPLGITDWAFDLDDKGLYMGGTGLMLSTNDFAKLGQLILQKGKWNGVELFTEDFYNEMVTPSKAILSDKTSPAVKAWEGPVGGSIWLNRKIEGVPQFFRTAPENMIYAGGKFGQFLLIFPSSNLIIARNGADSNHSIFWEPTANKAMKCFAPEEIQVEEERPAPTPPAGSWWNDLTFNTQVLNERFLVNMLALENCNCNFVQGFGNKDAGLGNNNETCKKLLPQDGADKLSPSIHVDFKKNFVEATTDFGKSVGSYAKAKFDKKHPTRGCRLVERAKPLF